MIQSNFIPVGLGVTERIADCDFECFSMAGQVWEPAKNKFVRLPGVSTGTKRGLPSVGTFAYASHPSTEVLSLAYDLTLDGSNPQVWMPGLPNPDDLFDYLARGGRIEAHNSMFEWAIWNLCCTKRYGWPTLNQRQLRCSMAKARAFGLPGGLDPLGEVLQLPIKKDKRGTDLLNKFSVPQNPSKKDARTRHLMSEDRVDGQALIDYNITDIKTERAASNRIPDLAGVEAEYWHLDQEINQRGVHVDLPNVKDAIVIIEQVIESYTAELAVITNGIKPSEIQQLKAFVEGLAGITMASFDDDAITETTKQICEMVQDGMLPEREAGQALRVLEIRQACSSASVKKVYAMVNQVGPNQRLYNLFNYHAAKTGRPTGEGPQPTNMPKAGPSLLECKVCGKYCGRHHKSCAWCSMPFPPTAKPKEWNAEMAEQAIQLLATRDFRQFEHYYGHALETVSGCLRGMFTAAPDHDLIASDFNAIEAVVIAQLAGEEWRLEVFRTHGKIYEASAAKITGVPFEEFMAHRGYDMTKPEWWKQSVSGPHHPLRGKIGKYAELSLGFGGWINGMKAFGADEFLSDQEIKDAILGWREASPMIVEFWGGQYRGMPWDKNVRPELYGLEGMAIKAMQNPGHWYEYREIAYKLFDDVLYCRLPSGRCIHYQRPRLRKTIYMGGTQAGKDKQLPAFSLSFEGWNTNPKSGPPGWITIETYGGKLTENCIAEGTKVLSSRGWVNIESVQDDDLIHDGVEFVRHGGKLFKSVQACVMIDGVYMTSDHEVLTDEGWKTASQHPRPYRPAIRNADCNASVAHRRQKMALAISMRLRQALREKWERRFKRRESWPSFKLRVHDEISAGQEQNHPWYEQSSGLCGLAKHERSMPFTLPPSVGEIWRQRYNRLRGVARIVRNVLGRHGRNIPSWLGVGTHRQFERLLARQLHMGHVKTPGKQHAVKQNSVMAYGRENECFASGGAQRDKQNDSDLPTRPQLADAPVVPTSKVFKSRVWDIVNCGPRHRFVVLGNDGPFIVHNCVQAVARDYQRDAQMRLDAAGYPIVLHVYDENVAEVPKGWGSLAEFETIMKQNPVWAPDWPINASGGWIGHRYRKD